MKKTLSLILALTMLLMLVAAGCSGTADVEAEPEQATAEASEAPASEAVEESTEVPSDDAVEEAEPVPEAETVEAYDFTAQLPLSEEPATLSALTKNINLMGPLASLGYTEYGDMPFWAELEELTNVHMEMKYISFMAWSEQYNLFIAAGDYTDLVFGGDYTSGLTAAVEDDYIIDLSPYIEEYAPNYYNRVMEFGYEEDVTTEGLWLSINSFYDEFRSNQGLLMRKDWLDNLNLEVPTSWDEWHDVLLAFKTEYDPFKTIDINSECVLTNFGSYDFPLYSVGMSSLPYYQIDGEVHCSLTEDCYRDYLKTLNQYYVEGIINPEFFTYSYDPTSSQFNGWITSDDMGVWCSSVEGIATVDSLETSEGFEIVPVNSPADNEEGKNLTTTISISDMSNTLITTGCEDIELALAWMDFWYTNEGVNMYNYGVEGVDFNVVDGQVELTDKVTNNEFGTDITQYLRAVCPYGNLTGMAIRTRTAFTYTDMQREAWDLWTSTVGDGERAIPQAVTLSTDASNERTNISSDIATYADECISRFVMGELNFESDWDEFVAGCESMDIARCIELTQEAYNEYLGK